MNYFSNVVANIGYCATTIRDTTYVVLASTGSLVGQSVDEVITTQINDAMNAQEERFDAMKKLANSPDQFLETIFAENHVKKMIEQFENSIGRCVGYQLYIEVTNSKITWSLIPAPIKGIIGKTEKYICGDQIKSRSVDYIFSKKSDTFEITKRCMETIYRKNDIEGKLKILKLLDFLSQNHHASSEGFNELRQHLFQLH